MRTLLLAGSVAIVAAIAACGGGREGGGDSNPRDVPDAGGADASGEPDAGVDPNCFGPANILCHGLQPTQYSPGLTRPTQDGKYNVSIWFEGTGPKVGTQVVKAKFVDAVTGNPVPGLKTRFIADLHDIGPAPNPTATDLGGGMYQFKPVTLDQTGYWEIVILSLVPNATGPGSTVSLIDLFFWAE